MGEKKISYEMAYYNFLEAGQTLSKLLADKVKDLGGEYVLKTPFLSTEDKHKIVINEYRGIKEEVKPIVKVTLDSLEGTMPVFLREGDDPNESRIGGRYFKTKDADIAYELLKQIDEETAPTPDEKKYPTLKFEGKDIIITDPCYILKNDEEDIENYAIEYTLYGDWSCTTFNTDTDEALGDFCADAGKVGVFDLAEVRKVNSEVDKWVEEHSWCATVIPNFTGEITFEVEKHESEGFTDYSLHVVGKGNINFKTYQTGF